MSRSPTHTGAASGVLQMDSLLGTAGRMRGEKRKAGWGWWGVICSGWWWTDCIHESWSRQPHPHRLLVPRSGDASQVLGCHQPVCYQSEVALWCLLYFLSNSVRSSPMNSLHMTRGGVQHLVAVAVQSQVRIFITHAQRKALPERGEAHILSEKAWRKKKERMGFLSNDL